MLKVGELFFTKAGYIGKVIGEFNFHDGYKFNGAIWSNGGWSAIRLNPNGGCAESNSYSYLAPINEWSKMFMFSITYNPSLSSWQAEARHKSEGSLNVTITMPGKPEKLLEEAKKAAFDKILDYVRPLGYELKLEDQS